MDAGKLTDRLTVKTLVSASVDIHGENILTFSTSSLWCNAKTEGGSETDANGVNAVQSRYAFTIRHNAAVVESSDIEYRGFAYDIAYIESPYGRNQWMVIHAARTTGGN